MAVKQPNQLADYLERTFTQDGTIGQFLTKTDVPLLAMNRVGFDALMLDRVQRQLRAAEIQADIAMKGNTDGIDTLYPEDAEGQMGVAVGNTYNITVQGNNPAPVDPPAITDQSVPTNTNTSTEKTIEKTTTNPILPWIVSGIVALGGMGTGLALYLHKPAPPVPVVDTDTDTNSVTDVQFPE